MQVRTNSLLFEKQKEQWKKRIEMLTSFSMGHSLVSVTVIYMYPFFIVNGRSLETVHISFLSAYTVPDVRCSDLVNRKYSDLVWCPQGSPRGKIGKSQ